ncbi:glycosyltransferase family 4 protein [Zychaea mexicana]|uniref:glycosyltransferase family 4 protein n=1 Tax=Zychaea mexicana TaxID=64656 RepID=UPI0022FDED02|nr:glycosyltransferase family 4 protein [Zychaea mexicana]KAI9499567.1 glycosyltransferase family 4 protein [Zychaea mexicana]
MAVSFWVTTTLVSIWLIYRFLRLRTLNSVDVNRQRVLQDLGRDHTTDAGDSLPIFLGFFHPYCNAGGGGERVLWTAIRDVQKEFPHVICAVYTGDLDASKQQILYKVKDRFNIDLDPRTLALVYLRTRYLVEDSRYPRFTLLFQSLSSIVMGYEAISKLVPDLFFDTMGYAFTYPLVHYLTRVRIATYTHYPTISSDMLKRVYERRQQHNNNSQLAQSTVWTYGKLIYYHVFARVYGWCGSFAEIVMVNSTWTKDHIDKLWKTDSEIVYPPCDTERLNGFSLQCRVPKIVSVAQFRPEKDHPMQLQALAKLFEKHPKWRQEKDLELVLIGSARNEGDEKRIAELRKLALELNIEEHVRLEVNASFDTLVDCLGKAKIGIHTMWNEHFGIGIVEYMAAGMIPVAHNSAGPKLDIVADYDGRPTGFLADSVDSFADCLDKALSLPEDEFTKMASNARAAASDKFSEVAFSREMMQSLRKWLT